MLNLVSLIQESDGQIKDLSDAVLLHPNILSDD